MIKKRRLGLDSLAGIISGTDLERVSEKVEGNLGGAALTRKTIERDLDKNFGSLLETVTLPTTDDEDYEWTFLEPCRLIQLVVESCPELGAAYIRASNERMPTLEQPWKLLICFDEFAPGVQLNCENTKKVMVLSFNFEELGGEILQRDTTWMIPIIVRSTTIRSIIGYWSNMLRVYFRTLLLGNQGGQTVGVTVMASGQPLTLFFTVEALGSDYDGIRIGWDWKGANGLRMCLRCCNCLKKNSDLAHRIPNCVEASCTDKTRFIERTDQDFEDDVDLVIDAGREYAANNIGVTRLNEIEMVTGQKFNPLAWYADEELRRYMRPLRILNQDWVHGVLSDGSLFKEINLLVRADHATSREDYEAFLKSSDLKFPSWMNTKGSKLWRIFDSHRNDDGDPDGFQLKGDASEILGLYRLLRHFVELNFSGRPHELVDERNSFNAACTFVDKIIDMKNGVTSHESDADILDLEDSYWEYLRNHFQAYGDEHMTPKFHLNHCLAKQFMKRILDAFICERLHLRVKPIVDRIDNTRAFEKSVLLRSVASQIHSINEGKSLRSGLRGPVVASSVMAGVSVASRVDCAGLLIGIDDIVRHGASVGVVKGCACQDDQLFVIATLLEHRGEVAYRSGIYRPTNHQAVFEASGVVVAVSWYKHDPDLVVLW